MLYMNKASQPVIRPAKISLVKLPSRLLYLLVVMLPLLIWPGALFSFEGIKKYFFLTIVLAAVILYLFNSWRGQHLHRLSSLWLVALWSPVVVALFASLSSPAPRQSLIGLGSETGTFFFLTFLSLLATLVPLLWRNRQEVFNVLLIILGVGLITILFQIIRVGLGNFTFLSVFSSPATNLIGSWNELGIFSGFIFLLSLSFIKFLPWRRTPVLGVIIALTFVLSLFSILFINHWIVLLAVGLGTLLIWFSARSTKRVSVSWRHWRQYVDWSLWLGLILILLSFFGQPGNFNRVFKTNFDLGTSIVQLNNRLNVNALEVSPSWGGTWILAQAVLNSQPILGVGPNKFSAEWFKDRPVSVNETPFWQDEFSSGIGNVPSSLVTMGLVGLASYLFLLGVILWTGYLLWRVRKSLDQFDAGINLIIFILVCYLWFFNIFYSPGVVILAFTFLLTGLLITGQSGLNDEFTETVGRKDGVLGGFFSTFGVWGGLISCFVLLVLLGQSFWSNFTYNRGLVKALNGNLSDGEILMARAASLNPNDVFYRSLVDLDLTFLNNLLGDKNISQDEAKTRFQNILSAAIGNAKAATEYNKNNYLNWSYLGRVYESIVPLKVSGAYDEGLKSYSQARELNPNMPSVWLDLARLELAAGNTSKARGYLDQAVKLKRDYVDAIMLIAQLDAPSGDLSEALSLAEQAVNVSPSDPTAFFALGILKYQSHNYTGARDALSQAVALNPNYANARYFLGLAYDYLGQKNKALEQFQIILTANNLPEIKQIIANLQAGRGALVNTAPAATEERTKLPTKNKNN